MSGSFQKMNRDWRTAEVVVKTDAEMTKDELRRSAKSNAHFETSRFTYLQETRA